MSMRIGVSKVVRIAGKSASAAVLIGLVGTFGTLAGYPWLFASFGPTAALQVTMPQMPMSRALNVAVGHLLAVGVGFAAIYATGALSAPAFASGQPVTFVQVEAAALAIFFGIGLEFIARASHAPAASITLLIALELVTPQLDAVAPLVCGIALITILGEGARRLQFSSQNQESHI
jgi:hypothetical protein